MFYAVITNSLQYYYTSQKEVILKGQQSVFSFLEFDIVFCQTFTRFFFIEYLTQNVIFHVKIHVTKHVFEDY